VQSLPIFKDVAFFWYGSQQFRLRRIVGSNCLQLDMKANARGQSAAYALLTRLMQQMEETIAECMGSLAVIPAVPYPYDRAVTAGISWDEYSLSDKDNIISISSYNNNMTNNNNNNNISISSVSFLPLRRINEVVALGSQGGGLLDSSGIKELLSAEATRETYAGWLPGHLRIRKHDRHREGFHVFISYRWNHWDKSLTQGLYEGLTLGPPVGHSDKDKDKDKDKEEHLEAVSVFLDDRRLSYGDALHEGFTRGLLTSTVAVPIVSAEAMDRLLPGNFKADAEDNLLMEWLLMYCHTNKLIRNVEKSTNR
jgi:hypothetical protein